MDPNRPPQTALGGVILRFIAGDQYSAGHYSKMLHFIGSWSRRIGCALWGHVVDNRTSGRHVETRAGYAEFVCLDCGHPFCLSETAQSGYVESLRATQVVMQR